MASRIGVLIYVWPERERAHSIVMEWANERAAEILGSHHVIEMLGQPLAVSFPDVMSSGLPEQYHDTLITGSSHVSRLRYGDEHARHEVYEVRSERLDAARVAVFFRVVTEAELLRSELEQLVQTSPVAMVSLELRPLLDALEGVESTVVGCLCEQSAVRAEWMARCGEPHGNAAARRLLGAPDGLRAGDLFPSCGDFLAFIDAVGSGRPTWTGETTLWTRAGDERHVTMHLSVVRGPASCPAVFSIVDHTEARRAQQTLQSLNQGLEQAVDERTRQLSLANQEMESFVYAASHDLRTPLRGIHGFASAILEDHGDSLDGEVLELVRGIRSAGDRMGCLIDDLLGLSRLGRVAIEPADVDVSAMVHRIVRELAGRDPSREVVVRVEEDLSVHGDPALVRQAFECLLGNAWKFTARTKAAEILVERDELAGSVCVRDNGAGFDPRFADKVFLPFERLHHRADFPGSGVGLAAVQRIVQRHGGWVKAHGEVGSGAAFTLSFGGA